MLDRKYDDVSMQLIDESNGVDINISDLYISCLVILSPSFNVHIQYHHYFNGSIASDDNGLGTILRSQLNFTKQHFVFKGKRCISLRFTNTKSDEMELLLVLGSHEIAEKWKHVRT